nr:hypothetical protein [Tanacetum cinerariifolium]
MGIIERIKEIEAEMARTQKNKATGLVIIERRSQVQWPHQLPEKRGLYPVIAVSKSSDIVLMVLDASKVVFAYQGLGLIVLGVFGQGLKFNGMVLIPV